VKRVDCILYNAARYLPASACQRLFLVKLTMTVLITYLCGPDIQYSLHNYLLTTHS